ncbi:MAG TPA: hypothetical protein VMF52_15050 [Steroidobacteraceae bacterium]|nr:hypothetical protein [Steroidobacteraceae bacterium]
MKRLLALALMIPIAAAPALATTYVRVEKDGTKTYSDRPIPGGQPVELQSAQTYSAPSSSGGAASTLPSEQQLLNDMGEVYHYQQCTLRPNANETFVNPEQVSIGALLRPNVRVGDVIEMLIDGTSAGKGTTSYVMKPVPRGTHSVTMTVKDRFGRVLCEASTQFHVHQPSVNAPARQPPPRPPKPKG